MNTVSEDLNLSNGEISKAILAAAGPRLQQMLNAQDAHGVIGEVIPTDGCNLRCRQVYHAIAPQWDKDKDASKKVKYFILILCELHKMPEGLILFMLCLPDPKWNLQRVLGFGRKRPHDFNILPRHWHWKSGISKSTCRLFAAGKNLIV